MNINREFRELKFRASQHVAARKAEERSGDSRGGRRQAWSDTGSSPVSRPQTAQSDPPTDTPTPAPRPTQPSPP